MCVSYCLEKPAMAHQSLRNTTYYKTARGMKHHDNN